MLELIKDPSRVRMIDWCPKLILWADWNLFLRKLFPLWQQICLAVGHVSKNGLKTFPTFLWSKATTRGYERRKTVISVMKSPPMPQPFFIVWAQWNGMQKIKRSIPAQKPYRTSFLFTQETIKLYSFLSQRLADSHISDFVPLFGAKWTGVYTYYTKSLLIFNFMLTRKAIRRYRHGLL